MPLALTLELAKSLLAELYFFYMTKIPAAMSEIASNGTTLMAEIVSKIEKDRETKIDEFCEQYNLSKSDLYDEVLSKKGGRELDDDPLSGAISRSWLLGEIFFSFVKEKNTSDDKEQIVEATEQVIEVALNITGYVEKAETIQDIEFINSLLKGALDKPNDGNTSRSWAECVVVLLNHKQPATAAVEEEHLASEVGKETVKGFIEEGVMELIQEVGCDIVADSLPGVGLTLGCCRATIGAAKAVGGTLGVSVAATQAVSGTVVGGLYAPFDGGKVFKKNWKGSKNLAQKSLAYGGEGVLQFTYGTTNLVGQVPGTQAVTIPTSAVVGTVYKRVRSRRKETEAANRKKAAAAKKEKEQEEKEGS